MSKELETASISLINLLKDSIEQGLNKLPQTANMVIEQISGYYMIQSIGAIVMMIMSLILIYVIYIVGKKFRTIEVEKTQDGSLSIVLSLFLIGGCGIWFIDSSIDLVDNISRSLYPIASFIIN